MAKIEDPRSATVRAIFERHERDASDWRRAHLGASQVGRSCSRELWYGFRWVAARSFDGRMLRLFERGDREEAWLVEELRAIGCEVWDVDDQGRQWRVSWHGGHVGGSCDGVVLGVLEAPKTPHLFESKTSNRKRFEELQRKGVAEAKPEHYVQMQLYMRGLKLERALYVVVCKDNDEIYVERVKLDRKFADAQIARAGDVVFAPEPPSRISEDPTWFECRWCDYREPCQLGRVDRIERNCRTCLSSTPLDDGSWSCDHHGEAIDDERQRKGCDDHLFVPALLPWQAIDADDTARFVVYRREDGSEVVDRDRGLHG